MNEDQRWKAGWHLFRLDTPDQSNVQAWNYKGRGSIFRHGSSSMAMYKSQSVGLVNYMC